jgi:hypothetical protein
MSDETPLDERIEKLADAAELTSNILSLGARDIRQMLAELKVATENHEMQMRNTMAFKSELDRARECLKFFASVIKSGEPWTDTCEVVFRKAMPDPANAKRPQG